MSIYDRIAERQQVPRPRYKCEHVKAGFLTAARIDLDKGTVDVCQACFDSKAFMRFVDERPTVEVSNTVKD